MKKISILLMLITSIALTYQSHRISKNSNLWFENRTIESLAGDDDYINGGTLPECTILCGLEEGHCWAGKFNTFGIIRHWECPHFTGDIYTYCKDKQHEVSTRYEDWKASRN